MAPVEIVQQEQGRERVVVGQGRTEREAARAARQHRHPSASVGVEVRLVEDEEPGAREPVPSQREHVGGDHDPVLVEAEAGKVGPQLPVRVGGDGEQVPRARRVTGLRDGDQHGGAARFGVGNDGENPSALERVVGDLGIEGVRVPQSRPEGVQRDRAERRPLAVLDAHLRVQRDHQVVWTDRAVGVGRDGVVVVLERREARAGPRGRP